MQYDMINIRHVHKKEFRAWKQIFIWNINTSAEDTIPSTFIDEHHLNAGV